MRAPDDARQVSRDRRCLLPAELLDLDLEVLRHQLPHGDAFVEQPGGHHPLPQVPRNLALPPDDALRVVARHLSIPRARRRGQHALLDADEAEIVRLTLTDSDADGRLVAPTA